MRITVSSNGQPYYVLQLSTRAYASWRKSWPVVSVHNFSSGKEGRQAAITRLKEEEEGRLMEREMTILCCGTWEGERLKRRSGLREEEQEN